MAVTVAWKIGGGLGSPPPEGEPGQEEEKLEPGGCGEGPGKCPSPGPPRSLAAQNLKV